MSLLLCVLSLWLGVFALSVAMTIWLAQLTQSAILALVIVGVFYTLLSWLIYRLWLHRTIRGWRGRLNTVYEVSETLEMAMQRVRLIMKKVADLLG